MLVNRMIGFVMINNNNNERGYNIKNRFESVETIIAREERGNFGEK